MATLAFLFSYFASGTTWSVIGVLSASIAFLYLLYRREQTRPKTRVRMASGILALNLIAWIFLASSMVLCFAFQETYAYNMLSGIRTVLGWALTTSLAAIPVVFGLVRRFTPRVILKKVGDLEGPDERTASIFEEVSNRVGMMQSTVLVAATHVPIAFSVPGENTVVVSRGLLNVLGADELETVIAHELFHLRNGDAFVRTLATACKKILPFDPIMRLVERSLHRDTELAADADAAELTSKPLALASSLDKISRPLVSQPEQSEGTKSTMQWVTLSSANVFLDFRIAKLVRLAGRLD